MRMNDKLGIVGLGRYKQLHELPGSDKTWNSAFNALHDAHEIFAIGFSMSYYDTMTRLHFGSVMHQRKIPPHRISIVDPNACKLAKDFSGVFRDRVCLVEQQAERINWDELLGS